MTPYCSTEIWVLLLSFQKTKQFLRWRHIWAELLLCGFPNFGLSLKLCRRRGAGHSTRAQDGLGGCRRQLGVYCHPLLLWALIFAFPMVAGPSFFVFVDLMGDVGIGSIDTFGSLRIIYLTMEAILYNSDRIKTFSAPTTVAVSS